MANETILIVDADPKSQKVLEVSLKKAGFRVVITESIEKAQQRLPQTDPALIIANTTLPDGDGLQFCADLKFGDHEETPFVFLTEERSLQQKMRSFELGADDYLTKPIYINEVVTRAELLIQRRAKQRLSEADIEEIDGDLAEITTLDLLQTIEEENRSGSLHIYRNGRQAAAYFDDGEILDAVCGKLQGKKAVFRIMRWTEGEFTLRYHDAVHRNTHIEEDSSSLLIEGMQQLEMWNESIDELPDLDRTFEADYRQLPNLLESLPIEVERVVRLFDGYRRLEDVIDDSPLDDVTTLEIIKKLVDEEILVDITAEPEDDGPDDGPRSEIELGDWLDSDPSEDTDPSEQDSGNWEFHFGEQADDDRETDSAPGEATTDLTPEETDEADEGLRELQEREERRREIEARRLSEQSHPEEPSRSPDGEQLQDEADGESPVRQRQSTPTGPPAVDPKQFPPEQREASDDPSDIAAADNASPSATDSDSLEPPAFESTLDESSAPPYEAVAAAESTDNTSASVEPASVDDTGEMFEARAPEDDESTDEIDEAPETVEQLEYPGSPEPGSDEPAETVEDEETLHPTFDEEHTEQTNETEPPELVIAPEKLVERHAENGKIISAEYDLGDGTEPSGDDTDDDYPADEINMEVDVVGDDASEPRDLEADADESTREVPEESPDIEDPDTDGEDDVPDTDGDNDSTQEVPEDSGDAASEKEDEAPDTGDEQTDDEQTDAAAEDETPDTDDEHTDEVSSQFSDDEEVGSATKNDVSGTEPDAYSRDSDDADVEVPDDQVEPGREDDGDESIPEFGENFEEELARESDRWRPWALIAAFAAMGAIALASYVIISDDDDPDPIEQPDPVAQQPVDDQPDELDEPLPADDDPLAADEPDEPDDDHIAMAFDEAERFARQESISVEFTAEDVAEEVDSVVDDAQEEPEEPDEPDEPDEPAVDPVEEPDEPDEPAEPTEPEEPTVADDRPIEEQKNDLRSMVNQGDAEALSLARDLTELAPRDAEIAYLHGEAAINARQFNEATQRLNNAINLGYTSADLYHSLGDAYASTGQMDQAEQAYRQFLELEPDSERAEAIRSFLER